MTRVFLTGGSGLIGKALIARLRETDTHVTALARSDTAAAALTEQGCEVVRGDLTDEAALAAGMEGCELVYNVAGVNTLCPIDREELYRVNLDGAAAVVRTAARAGVRRVVHTSSAATLGEASGTVGSEESPHRGWFLSTYERSKREGERAVLDAAGPVEVVCVNPASVQGPGRAGGTGKILLAYLNGRLKAFVDTRFSLVDIADCVEGHLLAAERGKPGERYVLCGATLSSAEAIALLRSIAGVDERPRMLPGALASAVGTLVEKGFRVTRRAPPVCREMVRTMLHGHIYDGSRATRELGLTYTPIEETFRRTIDWAVAQGLITRPLPAVRG
jgi:dihydroflavonol-4-reductase